MSAQYSTPSNDWAVVPLTNGKAVTAIKLP
jgi:hypothetical protein